MVKDFINSQVTGQIDIEIINDATGEIVTKDTTKNAITLTGIQYLTLLANSNNASKFKPFGVLNLINDTKKRMTKESDTIAGSLRGCAYTNNPVIPAGNRRGYGVKSYGSLRNGQYVLSVAFPSGSEIANFNGVCLSLSSSDEMTTEARYAAPFAVSTYTGVSCMDGPKNAGYIYAIKASTIEKIHLNVDKTSGTPLFTVTVEDSQSYALPSNVVANIETARWSDAKGCFIIPAYSADEYTGFLYLYPNGDTKFVSTYFTNWDADGNVWLIGNRGQHGAYGSGCTFIVSGNYAYCSVIRHPFAVGSNNNTNRQNSTIYYTLGKFDITTGELVEVLNVEGFYGMEADQYYTNMGTHQLYTTQVGPNHLLVENNKGQQIKVNIKDFSYEDVTGQYILNAYRSCHIINSCGLNIYNHGTGILFCSWVPSTVSYFINPTTNTVQTHNKPSGYSMKINYTFYIKDVTLAASQSIPDDTISNLAIQDLFYNACSSHTGVPVDPFCTAYVKNVETEQAEVFGGKVAALADSNTTTKLTGHDADQGVRIANNNFCEYSGEDLILKRSWFFDYGCANAPATHITTGGPCRFAYANKSDFSTQAFEIVSLEAITLSNITVPALLFNRINNKSYMLTSNTVYEIGLYDTGVQETNKATNKKELARIDTSKITLDQIKADGQTAQVFGYSEVTDRVYFFTPTYMYIYTRDFLYIERVANPLTSFAQNENALYIYDRYVYYRSTTGGGTYGSIRCYDLVEQKELWCQNIYQLCNAFNGETQQRVRYFSTDGTHFFLHPQVGNNFAYGGLIGPEGMRTLCYYSADNMELYPLNGLLGTGYFYCPGAGGIVKFQPYIGASVKFRNTYDKDTDKTFMPTLKHRIKA